MDKLNEDQLLSIEEFIESLTCFYCTEEDRDCSSCIIHNQLKENILQATFSVNFGELWFVRQDR